MNETDTPPAPPVENIAEGSSPVLKQPATPMPPADESPLAQFTAPSAAAIDKASRILARDAIAQQAKQAEAAELAARPKVGAAVTYFPTKGRAPAAGTIAVVHNAECCDLLVNGQPVASAFKGGTRETKPGQAGTFTLV